jgi:plasmid stabilization system protein ParE
MKVVYAPRAAADLREIGVGSRKAFGGAVAAALETYIRATIARIAVMPESGQRLPVRPAVRVVPLVRSIQDFLYRLRGDGDNLAHSTCRTPAMGRVGVA